MPGTPKKANDVKKTIRTEQKNGEISLHDIFLSINKCGFDPSARLRVHGHRCCPNISLEAKKETQGGIGHLPCPSKSYKGKLDRPS